MARKSLVIIVCVVSMAGCRESTSESNASVARTPRETAGAHPVYSDTAPPLPRRDMLEPLGLPETKRSALTIDGKKRTVTLRKFDWGPLVTYYPEELVDVDYDNHGITFLLKPIDGQPRADLLKFLMSNRYRTLEELRHYLIEEAARERLAMSSIPPTVVPEKRYGWAIERYTVKDTTGRDPAFTYSGTIYLGAYNGHPFTIAVASMPDTLPTAIPGIDAILSELRWKEDGSGLGPAASD